MLRLQAFKFELMPDGEQARDMRRFAGSCRFVFNKALAMQQERYAAGEKRLGYAGMCSALIQWKADPATLWLRDTPSQALQQTLKDLDRAYTNFFNKRADLPRFKKKGRARDSFRYPQGYMLDQAKDRLFLPKLGWVRYRNSREVLGTVKNITVSQSGGKWFASIQTEREVEIPLHQGTAVGIDLGIVRFATLSDGTVLEPLNGFKRREPALRKAQRRLSRKKKFSRNWRKAKAKVQRIQTKIANARRDTLHKATSAISKNHAMIVIEDLQVCNMSASAAGTVEAPGSNVRAKSGLNKAILDQGWFEFRRQLDYKSAWNGGHLIAVPAHYTSQTCPLCGHVAKENRQTQAQFACVACGFQDNADRVGAINVLRRGEAMLSQEGQDTADASVGWSNTARIACEVSPTRGQQQEPTEVTMDTFVCP
ncbi:MAG: transposase [Gammaproteobacteria bacterium]|nr:transposase [Gammaproteobacteria bacterium]